MVVGEKCKKQKPTEGDDSDHIDGELVLSIEKLQEVQDHLEKLNEEASDKVLEIEQKYNEVRRPIYIKRNEVMKSIPDFWLTAFLSHPALSDLLSEEDQEIFKYLDSLDVEDSKDVKSGYTITFNFKENPYFEDTKLTKTFAFSDDGSTKITGTDIRWKEGKSAANGVTHEKKGNKRLLHEISFFSWFAETDQKDIVDIHQDEVADIIKDDLWPNPLKYFNNEADEESDEDEEENGDDEQDDDGEDDSEG